MIVVDLVMSGSSDQGSNSTDEQAAAAGLPGGLELDAEKLAGGDLFAGQTIAAVGESVADFVEFQTIHRHADAVAAVVGVLLAFHSCGTRFFGTALPARGTVIGIQGRHLAYLVVRALRVLEALAFVVTVAIAISISIPISISISIPISISISIPIPIAIPGLFSPLRFLVLLTCARRGRNGQAQDD
jgi:hypothetical protein